MIIKYENIGAGAYWDDDGVPGWKSSGWSNDIECMAEEETEDLVIFGCFAILLWSHNSLYLPLNFRYLSMKCSTSKKWSTGHSSEGLSSEHW
jgi:hypothetical protein